MIFCIIGQSSSGKSTVERLLEKMKFQRLISYTTRPPRLNEVDHVDYHFISEDMFINLDSQGKFQEVARYRDWHYGLSLSGINYTTEDYIAVVTVHGYEEILKAVGKDNIIAIHIKVDERIRVARQLTRGDEVDEVIRRIHTDRKDFERVEEVSDYIIVNDKVENTLVEVYNIIGEHTSAK